MQQYEGWTGSIIHGSPIPQFVINKSHKIIYWNKALEEYSGIKAKDVLGTDQHWRAFYPEKRPCMADLLVDGKTDLIPKIYRGKYSKSALIKGAYEATDFFPEMRESGVWLQFTASPLIDKTGRMVGVLETLKDVTKRKEAEFALQESEEKYRTLVENVNDVIFTMDLTGIITYVSPVITKQYGYLPEEVEGNHFSRFVYQDDLQIASDGFKERTEGIFAPNVFRIIDKDGQKRYVRTSQTPRIEDNKTTGFNYVMTDITENMRIEEAVRAAVKLNILMDDMSVNDCISFTLDEAEELTTSKASFFHFVNPDEKTIQMANCLAENSTHFCYSKIPGHYYPVEAAGAWVDSLLERKPIIKNDFDSSSESKNSPKGSLLLKRELAVPIFDQNKIVAIIGVGNKASDYNESDVNILALLAKNTWTLIRRKRMEDALKESDHRFRELFNSTKSGVIIYRAVDEGADFVIVDFNNSAEIIEKVTKEEVIGKTVSEVFPAIKEYGLLKVFQDVWRTGKPESHPVSLYKDSRIASWRENYVYRLPSKEIVAVYEDVTESRHAEEELRKSEEKSLIYIKEAAMRLKNPMEVIQHNISSTIIDIESGDCDLEDVILQLQLQMKNMEQIRRNIIELNQAIIGNYKFISPASKKYLTE
ncbi:MAG: PAS domain S-box protein [Methanomicrobiaceae archaeon]|nr:PAS domain S-box protein [Methanomicrobiaceae archaeon]